MCALEPIKIVIYTLLLCLLPWRNNNKNILLYLPIDSDKFINEIATYIIN